MTRADRTAIAVIAAVTGLLGLLTVADGVWRTIALALGTGPVELIAGGDVPGNTGRMSSATVTSAVVGDGSRVLLVTGSAVALAVAATIYVACLVVLIMIARGTPFHRVLYTVLLVTGFSMATGGILAAGLDGLGRMMAGGDLGAPYEMAFELTLGPWAFGFVVLAAAYVVRAGQRLQRETEGLV